MAEEFKGVCVECRQPILQSQGCQTSPSGRKKHMECPPISETKANDVQPEQGKTADRYHSAVGSTIQHWDMVALFGLDYFQGNITKYVMRWRKKGGIQDLEKARHYLDKYIEVEKAKLQNDSERIPAPSSQDRGGSDSYSEAAH